MAQAHRGVRARFFHSPEHGHVVELSMVADPFQTTSIQKVTPEHVDNFPLEWSAYEAGIDKVDYGGTPLTEVPGIEASMVTAYALKGIHNAEHLAEITDGGLATFGLGARAVRDAARLLLTVKRSQAETSAARERVEQRRAAETEAERTEARHREAVERARAEADEARRVAAEQAEASAARIRELEAKLAASAEGDKADKAEKPAKTGKA